MRLNSIKSADGARKTARRVGRGIGSGLGKTCGRGHKGQSSRTGTGKNLLGFEGGQMPIHRRLPKSGFASRKAMVTDEICLGELNKMPDNIVNMITLKQAGLINNKILTVKIYKSGEIKQPIHVQGIRVTKGAREAIEAAGGKVE